MTEADTPEDEPKAPIDFYFDFSSPYGYLAAHKIDEMAGLYDREVDWKPVLLGVIFKTTGAQPLLDIPIKGVYARRDMERTARMMGLPFTLPEADRLFTTISGVAVPSVATAGGVSFEEATLFTHRGLSGPAILQVSSYWREGEAVRLNVLPGALERLKAARAKAPRAGLKAALSEHLPGRLAEALAERIGLATEMGNAPDRELERAAAVLEGLEFHPDGTEGYAKAEVTAGGVSTAELSSKTMEAKKVPGLYFIGEAVDVTGWLGGYNFQWAWASGVAAGQAVAG